MTRSAPVRPERLPVTRDGQFAMATENLCYMIDAFVRAQDLAEAVMSDPLTSVDERRRALSEFRGSVNKAQGYLRAMERAPAGDTAAHRAFQREYWGLRRLVEEARRTTGTWRHHSSLSRP